MRRPFACGHDLEDFVIGAVLRAERAGVPMRQLNAALLSRFIRFEFLQRHRRWRLEQRTMAPLDQPEDLVSPEPGDGLLEAVPEIERPSTRGTDAPERSACMALNAAELFRLHHAGYGWRELASRFGASPAALRQRASRWRRATQIASAR